jgi:hypothetical protein
MAIGTLEAVEPANHGLEITAIVDQDVTVIR